MPDAAALSNPSPSLFGSECEHCPTVTDRLFDIGGRALQYLDKIGLSLGRHRGPKTGHPYRDMDPRQMWARKVLSFRHIRGNGVEIGALHSPLPLYRGARAKYVDCFTVDEARRHYPELADFTLVTPDYVENGEQLSSIAEQSQDFIVANHFIEHCEDPIRTIKNLLGKLRVHGVLFMAVPMRDFTFDKERALTPVDHLARDHREGPEVSRKTHYEEWARHVVHASPENLDQTVRDLMDQHYSIHYHVWTRDTFRNFLNYLRTIEKLSFEVLEACSWCYNPFESVFILRRT